MPDSNAFNGRNLLLLELLSNEHDLQLVYLEERPSEFAPWIGSTPRGVEVAEVKMTSQARSRVERIQALARLTISDQFAPWELELSRVVESWSPDVVVGLANTSRPLLRVLTTSFPTVLIVDEDFLELPDLSRSTPWGIALQRLEERVCARAQTEADVVTVISKREEPWARRLYPRSRVECLTLPLDESFWVRPPAPDPPSELRPGDVFVIGDMAQQRNASGLAAIARELARHECDRRTRLVAASCYEPHEMLRDLPSDVVKFVGPVGDPRPWYLADATLVPAFAVSGVKSTVAQAWAMECPVVTTSEAAASVAGEHGVDLLAGSSAGEVAQLVIRVTQDRALRDQLAEGGRLSFERRHTVAAVRKQLDHVLELAAPRQRVAARAPDEDGSSSRTARALAFYLPQFHPIPENDEWWGTGFTEWTNTARARALFPRHSQPHIPGELGFYDLRDPEARSAQAKLAQEYGLEGFVYWHYWFGGGRRILERPFDEVLRSGEPRFGFCLAWANESWTGIWHGAANRVLVEQTYPGPADYDLHFEHLLPAFTDERYITVDGKPVFYVFHAEKLPNAREFVDHWQRRAVEAGLPGLFLLAEVSDLLGRGPNYDSAMADGFDGGVHMRFPADLRSHRVALMKALRKLGFPEVYEYSADSLPWHDRSEFHFPTVYPNWDNTPRAGRRGLVLHGSSPERFRPHVRSAVHALRDRDPQRRLLFIKSWNEWAEGNYLEPDLKFGRGNLEVLRSELQVRSDAARCSM